MIHLTRTPGAAPTTAPACDRTIPTVITGDLPDGWTWAVCAQHGYEMHRHRGAVWVCGQCEHATPLVWGAGL